MVLLQATALTKEFFVYMLESLSSLFQTQQKISHVKIYITLLDAYLLSKQNLLEQ